VVLELTDTDNSSLTLSNGRVQYPPLLTGISRMNQSPQLLTLFYDGVVAATKIIVSHDGARSSRADNVTDLANAVDNGAAGVERYTVKHGEDGQGRGRREGCE
jgi:hypothetical protein